MTLDPDRTPDHSGAASRPKHEAAPPDTILRFFSAERMLHWALAIPFVLLYATALGLVVFYGEPAPRVIRGAFAWAHRALGVALIVLPPIALLRGWRDWRVHLDNMREGWRWTRDDFRWLVLFPHSVVNPKVTLPEQGKFNAAEKLNFMMVSATYPFYIVTGLLVWSPGVALFSYLAHLGVAVAGLPLVLGHIFMATVNPDTRVGLSGMVTGWVDREWAMHHYRRWFRDRIETPEREQAARALAALLEQPARVKCVTCEEVVQPGSWRELVQRSFRVEPLVCHACEAPIPIQSGEGRPPVGEEIVRHLERHGAEVPFVPGESFAA